MIAKTLKNIAHLIAKIVQSKIYAPAGQKEAERLIGVNMPKPLKTMDYDTVTTKNFTEKDKNGTNIFLERSNVNGVITTPI